MGSEPKVGVGEDPSTGSWGMVATATVDGLWLCFRCLMDLLQSLQSLWLLVLLGWSWRWWGP